MRPQPIADVVRERGTVPYLLRMARSRGVRWLAASLWHYARARYAFRHATRVGRVRLRGRALVRNDGEMIIGDRVRLDGTTVRLEFVCARGARLSIGEGTYINYGSNVSATESVTIGRNCDIGQYAIIMDNNYHQTEDHQAMGKPSAVVIEDDVWLGARVIVLPGAHIGRGAVIGAHAVVRSYIPPYSLAGGVPARVIRTIGSSKPIPPDTDASAQVVG